MPWHPKTASTTAPNAAEGQSFLDNVVAGLGLVRLSNDPAIKKIFNGSNPAAAASQSRLRRLTC
jgi:hypothetical protein